MPTSGGPLARSSLFIRAIQDGIIDINDDEFLLGLLPDRAAD
jgi:hypothetical protein